MCCIEGVILTTTSLVWIEAVSIVAATVVTFVWACVITLVAVRVTP